MGPINCQQSMHGIIINTHTHTHMYHRFSGNLGGFQVISPRISDTCQI